MVSIIIVSYNCLSYLKICLKSLLTKTRSPYELIIIDNNSEDGTINWLAEYCFSKKLLVEAFGLSADNCSLKEIHLIINQQNQGYSRACNQGIKKSSGEFLALLNCDLMVSQEWLSRLIPHLEHDPEAGLVAPMGKIIGGEQNYVFIYHQYGYQEPESGLDSFADYLFQNYQGDYTESKFLIGCCILLKREVINNIGLLDPSLFMSADDFDYSLRARIAGFRLYVAEDCFVHHFNHKSFAAISADRADHYIKQGWQAFKEKWSFLLNQYNLDDLFYNQKKIYYGGLRKGRRANSH